MLIRNANASKTKPLSSSGRQSGNSRPHGGLIGMALDPPPPPTRPKNVLQHKNKFEVQKLPQSLGAPANSVYSCACF